MNVQVCRLCTGDYVVADVEKLKSEPFAGDSFRFTDPFGFEIAPHPKNVRILMGPFIPLGSPGNTIVVHERSIQFWIPEPSKLLVNKYMEQVTGVSLVPLKELKGQLLG